MSAEQDFWSRRRAGVAAEAQAEKREEQARAIAAEQATLEEKSDEEVLAELNLPDPDTLEAGDDFSVFMAKVVPDRIRRKALRKLWLTNPVLANVDQLVDYGEDFTDSAMVVENLQTAYQVGKGMLKHVEEMARKAEEAEAADEVEATPEIEEPEVIAAQTEPVEPEQETLTPEPPEETETAEVLVPRRMKFRFEETA